MFAGARKKERTRCTMEEKERRTPPLGIKTYLFIVYLATIPYEAFAENSLQAPRFTTSSSSSSIIRLGTTKIMQCQAFGNPSPQFRWMKDGLPITEFSTDAYYKIFSASHKDEGSYRCIASNKVGSIISEEMRILVAYMNVFEDQTEKSVSVVEGQAAILDLPEIESKPPPEVTWHTDDGQLPYAQKYAKSKSNQLIILSTDKSDQKAYRARAINTQEGKEENSAFVRLNVLETNDHKEIPPKIIVAPEDAKIVKGTSQTTLDCIANARPLHELETLWYKDNILIENGGMYTLNDIWNRSLTLISVNNTHSGQYECRVRLRSERFDTITATAKITVLEKPRFVSATRAETLGEYGTPISLPCDVVGIPKPNVTWYKNSELIDLNDKRYVLEEDNSLLIKKLLINDNGMFQCFAKSEAGESSISTWLRVKKRRKVRSLTTKYMRLRSSGERHNKKSFVVMSPCKRIQKK